MENDTDVSTPATQTTVSAHLLEVAGPDSVENNTVSFIILIGINKKPTIDNYDKICVVPRSTDPSDDGVSNSTKENGIDYNTCFFSSQQLEM